jgi:hypothetical protein
LIVLAIFYIIDTRIGIGRYTFTRRVRVLFQLPRALRLLPQSHEADLQQCAPHVHVGHCTGRGGRRRRIFGRERALGVDQALRFDGRESSGGGRVTRGIAARLAFAARR